MCVEDRIQVVKWQERAEQLQVELNRVTRERDQLRDTINAARQQVEVVQSLVYTDTPQRSRQAGPCPCACNSGGFCGGCGHAGCGGRR